jgi:hypothetical protein
MVRSGPDNSGERARALSPESTSSIRAWLDQARASGYPSTPTWEQSGQDLATPDRCRRAQRGTAAAAWDADAPGSRLGQARLWR